MVPPPQKQKIEPSSIYECTKTTHFLRQFVMQAPGLLQSGQFICYLVQRNEHLRPRLRTHVVAVPHVHCARVKLVLADHCE
jgi:hypothetical protein